jgi:DegV family protein with EDD domain
MAGIAVITDTGCDLPQDVRARYGVETVPMVVRFGQDECYENAMSLDEFWARAQRVPPYPQTSQVPVGLLEETFERHLAAGEHVLCLCITSKHSGTYNSACTAASRFPGGVTVVDTRQFSLLQGYQVIRAAEAVAEGLSLEEILSLLDGINARTQLFFAMDTVEYLRRGGRADQVMPLLDRVVRVLNIKPLLNVVDGQIAPMGAARSRDGAIRRIRQQIEKYLPAEMLFVLHSRLAEQADVFAASLAERTGFPLESMMIGEIGPVLSCHAGPRVIGAGIVQRQAQS